jgi:AAA ATPase domain
MTRDLRKFYQATDPGKALAIANPEDQQYYIDFSSVRGGPIIEKLKKKITYLSPDDPTCVLFTGHIGCGKSTELLRLQDELEKEEFHVIYFASSEDLEMTDVDICDILLAISRHVSESLAHIKLEEPKTLKDLLQGASKLLQTEVDISQLKLGIENPLLPKAGITAKSSGEFSLSLGIGEITGRVKSDSTLRQRLNEYLGPQKTRLLDAINQELLEPAIAKIKEIGKKGLVVIVDNLDRLDNRPKPFGRPQQEYIFVDQGESLSKLHCHLVYTMPLALKFSRDYGLLTQRFEEPRVLPMVPVEALDGSQFEPGMQLLRQMVLARAFPQYNEEGRLEKITEIFDSPQSLDRLCAISGGHIRDLLRLLNTWIEEEMDLPLTRDTLESVIRARRNEMRLTISDEDWGLLRQVRTRKQVTGDQAYQTLVRSRLVFEYRDRGESWFDINPILADSKELL